MESNSWWYITFPSYANTLADKLNPDLKANVNGYPSICHSIQTGIRLKKLYFYGKWQNHFTGIRLKKLYFYGKWQNHFTRKSVTIFTVCRNFIWMKNWIYITILSKKFSNQCMEQTNSKVPSKHSLIIQGLILDMAG